MNDPGEIRKALETARTIAVVGCSPRPDRPSHAIARYLMEQGYRVIPVNPGHQTILGEVCYRSLDEIPEEVEIDIVDAFRRSDQVGAVADAAIARGVGFFFMQQGVVDPDAARRLEAAGIPVAMDRCILVEHASRALPPRNIETRVER
ncbi:MAG TPA: CoA-binding protein [Thermoanaerobaculia bacterium]|nr:CoA-binding protein [Thermoanaerobaculia bacterium]